MDTLLLKLGSHVLELVSPLFKFELEECSWYEKRDLIDLAIHTAILNSYAEGVSEVLREDCGKHMPTSETLLTYVKTMSVDEVVEAADAQIALCVHALRKKGVALRKAALAFDWHDCPYYGSPETEGVVGTKPKRGTSYAFSFLTASVITPGKRLTLCALPLTERGGLKVLVLRLLEHILERYVKREVTYVAFDNGFQDSELLGELVERGIPFILPLRDTTKLRKRGRWMRYAKRFTYRTEGVEVDVVHAADDKGWEYFLATNLAATPRRILSLYKKRWGVETGYRKIGEFLPKTTSRSHVVRVFYFTLAVLLYNVWVILKAHAKQRIKVIRLKQVFLQPLFPHLAAYSKNLPGG